MPLVKSILEQELAKIMDSEGYNFYGFSDDEIEIADRWANAVKVYASSVIPVTTGSELGYSAFASIFATIELITGITVVVDSFTAYALAIIPGMLPAFVGTPPPVPIDFTVLYALPIDTDIETKISTMATIIDTWFRTGTAVPSGGGSVINWN